VGLYKRLLGTQGSAFMHLAATAIIILYHILFWINFFLHHENIFSNRVCNDSLCCVRKQSELYNSNSIDTLSQHQYQPAFPPISRPTSPLLRALLRPVRSRELLPRGPLEPACRSPAGLMAMATIMRLPDHIHWDL
jgi:hypothetical protein